MRSGPGWVLLAALLAVSGCGSAEDVASTATRTTSPSASSQPTPSAPTRLASPGPTPTPPPSPTAEPSTRASPTPIELAPRPRVGDCYRVDRAAFQSQRDGSQPVRCSALHTAETFAVFTASSVSASSDVDKAWRLCQARFDRYVGASATVSRLGFTVLIPDPHQVALGADWIRCDAIDQASYNGTGGLPRTGSVEGALTRRVSGQFRGCAKHWPKVDQPVHFTSCARRHQAELIPVSLNLGGPPETFPGTRISQQRSKRFCAANFQDYVPETLNYYYYYPTRESWRAGSHETTCWALDTRGDALPPI